jgi:hypothetical protein
MGTGASMQAQCALDMESAKPLDCSDVTDLNYAKMELMNARRQAQFYRNQALPKYQVDTTGDGIPNAIGYDTNKNGFIDSLDTTMDGLIDTVVVKYEQKLYYVPANMVGTTIVVSSGGNGEHYVANEEPKSNGNGAVVAMIAGSIAVGALAIANNNNGASFGSGMSDAMLGTALLGSQMVNGSTLQGIGTGAQQLGGQAINGVGQVVNQENVAMVGNAMQEGGEQAINGVGHVVNQENMAMVGSTIQEGGQQAMNGLGQVANQENMTMIGNAMQEGGEQAMNGLGQVANQENMTMIGNTMQEGGEQALEGGANLLQGSGDIMSQVMHGGEEMIGAIANNVGSVVNNVGNVGKEVVGVVGSVVNGVGNALKSVM